MEQLDAKAYGDQYSELQTHLETVFSGEKKSEAIHKAENVANSRIVSKAILHRVLDRFKTHYPLDYQRIDEKTIPVVQNLKHLIDCNVVDLGSNFGMYSLLLGSIAKSVTGIEIDLNHHKVSIEAKSYFESNGYDLNNVNFINNSAKVLPSLAYNGLLLTLVAYHLNNEEVELLISDAKKKCEKVLIQCRPGRSSLYQGNLLRKKVSSNNMFGGLVDIAGNVQLLEAMGMKKIQVHVSPKLYNSEVFPILIGSV